MGYFWVINVSNAFECLSISLMLAWWNGAQSAVLESAKGMDFRAPPMSAEIFGRLRCFR